MCVAAVVRWDIVSVATLQSVSNIKRLSNFYCSVGKRGFK